MNYDLIKMQLEEYVNVGVQIRALEQEEGDDNSKQVQRLQYKEEQLKNDFVRTMKELENGSKIDPERASLWIQYGFAERERENFEEAIAAWERGLEIDPAHRREWIYSSLIRDLDSWIELGFALHNHGSLAIAAVFWEILLEIDPEHIGSWVNLGLARKEQGNILGAMEAYKKIVEIAPGLREGLVDLGFTQQEQIDPCLSVENPMPLYTNEEMERKLATSIDVRRHLGELDENGKLNFVHKLLIPPWQHAVHEEKRRQFLALWGDMALDASYYHDGEPYVHLKTAFTEAIKQGIWDLHAGDIVLEGLFENCPVLGHPATWDLTEIQFLKFGEFCGFDCMPYDDEAARGDIFETLIDLAYYLLVHRNLSTNCDDFNTHFENYITKLTEGFEEPRSLGTENAIKHRYRPCLYFLTNLFRDGDLRVLKFTINMLLQFSRISKSSWIDWKPVFHLPAGDYLPI